LNNADVLTTLVQGILDGDAALQSGTELLDLDAPERGLYPTGIFFGSTARFYDARRVELQYATSFVAVDQFGRIAGVWNDQTYPGPSGSNASKWILGNDYGMSADNDAGTEYYEQIQILGDAIVKNQSFDAFTPRTGAATSTNWRTDDVAGATLNLVDIRQSIRRSLEAPSAYTLEDGVYFAQNDEGVFSYVVVRANAVRAIFLDQIEATEQATITGPDGSVYPLFTYDEQRAFGATIEGTPKLVYLDRGAYYEVVNGRVPNPAVRVTFQRTTSAPIIDEEATLTPVVGNTTSQMLGDAWIGESRFFSAAVTGKSPYVFNLDADGVTTTEASVAVPGQLGAGEKRLPILNALMVRDLIEEALLSSAAASEAVKALPTTATAAEKALAAAPFQYSNYDYAPDATIPGTPAGLGIANGLWFGQAAANVDGEIFFGYAVVERGQIRYFIVDGTRLVDGEIVLLSTLGDDEFEALNELEDGDDDFYEVVIEDIAKFLGGSDKTVEADQHKLVPQVVGSYDFTSRGIWGSPALTPTGYSERFGSEVFLVAEDVIRNSVQGVVAQKAASLGNSFRDFIDPAVASTVASTRVLYPRAEAYGAFSAGFTLNGTGNQFYTSNSVNRFFTRVTFESSNRDILDIAADGKITVRSVDADGQATVTMTLEFDNQIFTYSTTYNVRTVASYNRDIILARLHTTQHLSTATSLDNSIVFADRRVLQGFDVPLEDPSNGLYSNFNGQLNSAQLISEIRSGVLNVSSQVVSVVPTVQPATNTRSGLADLPSNNFAWYLNYGQSTQRTIRNLSELTPGTYTLTAALIFDRTALNPQIVTRRVNVTILSEVDAVALVQAAIVPGTLLPQGQITSTDKVSLSRYNSIVLGLSVNWELVNPATGNPVATLTTSTSPALTIATLANAAGSFSQQLSVTRNYSNEKLILRATVQRGYYNPITSTSTTHTRLQTSPNLLGNPVENFEFTVLATTPSVVQTRIATALKDWFKLLPSSIQLPLNADALIIESGMYRPEITTIDDNPTLRYELEYKGTAGYYVLPASITDRSAELDSGLVDFETLDGITHFILYRQVGDKDVSSGLVFLNNSTPVLLGYETPGLNSDDIPFLLLNAVTGDLTALNVSQLVFPAEAQAIAEVKVNILGRALLSTDSVQATKQVNAAVVTKEISIVKNPEFRDIVVPVLVNSGTRSIVININGVFAETGLSASMISVSGVASDSGLAAAIAINSGAQGGLQFVRESATSARIVGFSGTQIVNIGFAGTESGTVNITISANAFRRPATQIGELTSGISSTQVGAAAIASATEISFLSGVSYTSVTGPVFVVTLYGDSFAAGLTAGSGFGNGGLTAAGALSTAADSLTSGLSLIVKSIAPNRQSVTLVFSGLHAATGDLDPGNLVLGTVEIASGVLTHGEANLPVLRDAQAISVTPNDKLRARFLAE
jgi:hypothetical protein